MSDAPTDTYTVSFKTHGGYDASLLVVRGDTVQELGDNISALQELFDAVVDTEALLHAAHSLKAPEKPAKAAPAASEAPAQESAPAGVIKTCVHGKRTRRTGTSAKGGWVGHFCPQPKGAEQCEAIWGD